MAGHALKFHQAGSGNTIFELADGSLIFKIEMDVDGKGLKPIIVGKYRRAGSGAAEPDQYGLWHSRQIPDPAKRTAGLNVSGFMSTDLDKAIDAARSPQLATGCDQPARAQHYETFNRLLNIQQPYLFAFTPDTLLASPRALRGLAAGTYSLYADVQRWWLQK